MEAVAADATATTTTAKVAAAARRRWLQPRPRPRRPTQRRRWWRRRDVVVPTANNRTARIAAPITSRTKTASSLPLVAGSGVLEMHPNGYGFLRNPDDQLHPRAHRSVRARHDDREVRPPRRRPDQRHGAAASPQPGPAPARRSSTSTACRPKTTSTSRSFDELTPINPEEWLKLETGPDAARPRG